MRKRSKAAMSIVEMIVAISLLAILGTITYVSFSKYSINARDSSRATSVKKLVSSLHLFESNVSHFPETSSGVSVTFSGAEVWNQGVFGIKTLELMDNLNILPIDKGTGNEFSYSRTKDKKEYEVGAIFEGGHMAYPGVPSALARGGKIATAYIKGNYNGVFATASTGSKTYILALPSITNSDMTITNISSIISEKKLSYNTYSNLPSSYSESDFNTNGGFDFSPGRLVVYSTNDTSRMSNQSIQIQFLLNLQEAYTGTLLTANGGEVEKILSTSISNQEQSLLLSQSLIHYYINRGVRIRD